MRKKRKGTVNRFLSFVLILATFVSVFAGVPTESVEAATSYTEAKKFYNSTDPDKDYHAEMKNGNVYFATRGKIASSSTNLRYRTIGFDITLSAGGTSISFAVCRPDGPEDKFGIKSDYMIEVDREKDGDYEYELYYIEDDKLYDLAELVSPSKAKKLYAEPTITVYIDSIMTTRKGNELDGTVEENGDGTLSEEGDIYHLKDSDDLEDLMDTFSGHLFESDKNIKEYLDNYLLKVRYDVNGLDNSIKGVEVGSGCTISDDGVLKKSGDYVETSARILQRMKLIKPSDYGIEKTGYSLEKGKEWITDKDVVFKANTSYRPKKLSPLVGEKNINIYIYANWKANPYTIKYNGNGATSGSMADTPRTYDDGMKALRENLFKRNGYEFVGWSTTKNGKVVYEDMQKVENLTATKNGTVTLYAVWEPEVYKITVDKQGGSDGTNTFYEKYGDGYYSDSAGKNKISNIVLPNKLGNKILGLFKSLKSTTNQVVSKVGSILADATEFTRDTTIYAHWEEEKYKLTFDHNGGIVTDRKDNPVEVTYDSILPTDRGIPINGELTFKGYFTKDGTRIYDEKMQPNGLRYTWHENITLYAQWEDIKSPDLTLTGNDTWTNEMFTMKATAYDYGYGLKSIYIYRINADNTLTQVAKKENLNGAKSVELTYENTTEGAVRYKAVATDVAGNSSEYYSVVYYDTTAPQGEIIDMLIENGKFYFEIDITDINIGD